jgi:hypothetical protein
LIDCIVDVYAAALALSPMDVAKAAPAISAFFMVMRFQKRSGSRISSCRRRMRTGYSSGSWGAL